MARPTVKGIVAVLRFFRFSAVSHVTSAIARQRKLRAGRERELSYNDYNITNQTGSLKQLVNKLMYVDKGEEAAM